jgi:signal transduction histidine kinase
MPSFSPAFIAIALPMLLLLFGGTLPQKIHAQNAADPTRVPLTTVEAILNLGPEKADAEARPVKVRGVVTFITSSQTAFKIHDGKAGIGISLPDQTPCPKVGDLVEVEGHTKAISVLAFRYPHIEGTLVSVTGVGELPSPLPVSVSELASFKHYNQWVSVEGIVVMWTLKAPTLSLMISGPDTWAVVHVRGFTNDQFPTDLHGARIRVTGVNMGISHSPADTLMAPSPAQLEVLAPGKQDLFDLPLTPLLDVAQQSIPPAERVRIRGVVTATTGKQIVCLTDGTSAACVGLEPGWIRSSSAGHLYADGGSLPDLNPGDEVEVVGSRWLPNADSRENGFSLHLAHVRIVGSQAPPEPVPTTLATIAQGGFTHHLVQVRARLVYQDQFPLHRNLWRTTLMLESEGIRLPATFQSRTKTPFHSLNPNDELLVTGLVDPATASAVRQLWLVSPADVVSLGLSPLVRQRQIWTWAGIALAIAVIACAWIATLHRSLKRQAQAEATVKELNLSLEKRVHERTVELHKTQAELKRSLEYERELGELKSRFVTMVSHEFRTPLGIIMSAIELMRHYEDRLPEDQKLELQNDIHDATKLMAGLMEQVLVLGRVEAGKLGYRPVSIDLDVLAGKLTDECLSVTNHKCPILWQPQGDVFQAPARADETLLRHIFGNLITNAVKYSPAGSPVCFTAHRDDTDAVFEVRDTGIGIPKEDLPQLFEAFFRCSNVEDIPGTGLGLVIVKRCVDLHGGNLNLVSKVGQGTTFTIRLPLFAPVQTNSPALA